jgi:CTP synthase
MDQPVGRRPRGVGMTKSASRTKYIFVTGGVVSSLGKGVASASIGALLEARGLKGTLVKMDPYINVDPGTNTPFQDGEVLSPTMVPRPTSTCHYERWSDAHQPPQQLHHRRIYHTVIERSAAATTSGTAGDPASRRSSAVSAKRPRHERLHLQVGGTVGDIESRPSSRRSGSSMGRRAQNALYVHLTLVPPSPRRAR